MTAQDYYSTKRVSAWEQDREGQPGMAIKYQDGYQSWCPLKTFQRDYQPLHALSFGHAIHALKAGSSVRRSSWGAEHIQLISAAMTEKGDLRMMAEAYVVRFRRVTPSKPGGPKALLQPGWTPTQEDMLAADWQVVP